jgi:transposase-like protein
LSTLIQNHLADDLPAVIIADETMLQVKDMLVWFWYAIDPETRTIVHWKIGWNRTNSKKFFQEIEQRYGKKAEVVVTDGGHKILPRIGWSHEAISGGIRSYAERVTETVKDRTRLFDHYS